MNTVNPVAVEYAPGKYYYDYPLPGGAILQYYPDFLSKQEIDFYYETFELLDFLPGTVRGGTENRLSRFYSSDPAAKPYYYAGKKNIPLPMNEEMLVLGQKITETTGNTFNSCLVNYYANGTKTIGLHSDSETSLVKGSAIGSISLGTERFFDVVAKDNAPNPEMNKIRINMQNGSLIIMAGTMQEYYKHQVPRQATILTPRINLTYRLYHA